MESRRTRLIKFFSRSIQLSFCTLLELDQICTEINYSLFRVDNFDDEWFSEWKKYIFNIADDQLILRPFDGSYDHKLLNVSMLRILEVLNACSRLPPVKEVYEQALQEHVENMARACNIGIENFEKFKTNFDKFIELVAIRREYIRNNGADEIELNDEITANFRGSIPNLVFGKIVGDALGLHPVFGALLNPTGGIVGKNNSNALLRSLVIFPSIKKNAIIHDATGYLRYYHGIGPGYKYLDVGDIRGRLTAFNGVLYGYKLPLANIRNLYTFEKNLAKEVVNYVKDRCVMIELRDSICLCIVFVCCFALLHFLI
ncbi:Protein of unknown function DUF909 [Oopsacas minuta]|uniref:Uncharacterized protein n=1 Tax=Oopsacas minuta TaxID=111878 RepID=A0AAV7K1U1_9METZ|nr:Protein of unknown function DUF909 [Oopsacas minuta]